jgi:phosphopantetheine adenylyltransferase
MVKEIAKHGGDISRFVPAPIVGTLLDKIKNTPK